MLAAAAIGIPGRADCTGIRQRITPITPLAVPLSPAPLASADASADALHAPPLARHGQQRLLRLTNIIAIVVAALVGVGAPTAHFSFGLRYTSEILHAETEARVRLLSALAESVPEGWQDRLPEIRAALSWQGHSQPLDQLRLFTPEGGLLAESTLSPAFASPTMTRTQPVVRSETVLAWLETRHSLRPLLIETLEIAAVSTAIALVIFLVLRAVPLRALRTARDQVCFLANIDPLTGLPNRLLFRDHLDQTLARIASGGEPAALLLFDLDHFKDVNDAFGHSAGDRLLQQVATRLQRCVRRTDTIARLGGDEFAIIQVGVTGPEVAARLAQRIVDALAPTFDIGGRQIAIGVSVGVTLCTRAQSNSAEGCLRDADIALYRAKSLGRGRCCFFEEAMNERLLHRMSLEYELRQALRLQQLEIHYQPQLSLPDGTLVGVEALVRWRHPQRGLITPSEFIPLAEETGLIDALGEQVLRLACREAAGWRDLRVAVNLSPAQFRRPGLETMVASALAETGFDPNRLELEMTEGVLLHDTDANLATLRALKALGVRIAMDDFGTGFSSLGYLRRFPFDKIKIDRSFVRDLGEDANASVIVNAVVALSHSLGMPVTAEGVETDRQLQMLLRTACDEGQGFLFGRPMPAADLAALLDQQAALSRAVHCFDAIGRCPAAGMLADLPPRLQAGQAAA